MKHILVVIILFISFQSFCQEDTNVKFKKHSLGLEYEFNDRGPNFGVTYRKFHEKSKYNFKASFFMGGNRELTYARGEYSLIYRTKDSATPHIIVSNPRFNTSASQRLELGIERTFGLKKFDLILGADLIFGHKYYSQISAIDKAGEAYYPKNGIPYYRLIAVNSEAYGSVNSLTSTINSLTGGIGLQGGAKFELFSNLYFTVLANLRMDAEFTINEKNEYRNDLFKEHLPTIAEYSIFNIDLGMRMGLHYRF